VQARLPHVRKPREFGRERDDPRSKFAGLRVPLCHDDPAEE
jgi:hypothetical protein